MLDSILLPQARSRWMLPALRSLTPDAVANILSQALPARSPLHEQQLYLLMQQTWPRLCKNISEVKNAVINLPWRTAQPEGLPAALPRELLDKARLGMRGDPFTGTLGWEGMLRHLLDAWFRGISVVELIWEARGRWILPKCAVHVPPWHYGWAGTPSGINSAPPPPASAAANTGHLVLYPDHKRTALPTEQISRRRRQHLRLPPLWRCTATLPGLVVVCCQLLLSLATVLCPDLWPAPAGGQIRRRVRRYSLRAGSNAGRHGPQCLGGYPGRYHY